MSYSAAISLNFLQAQEGLDRLEQVLGLARPRLGAMDRIFRYATACVGVGIPGWRGSLQVDRFGTAQHLLRQREDALLAGWEPNDTTISVLAGLAEVEAWLTAGLGRDLDTPADRLRRIHLALTRGVRVPVPVSITEPQRWPLLWRRVAEAVGAEVIKAPVPLGQGSLGAWQHSLSGVAVPIPPDATLALTAAHGRQSAAQALAALLGEATPERRASTVVICADADLVAILDDRLIRAGLPRLGAPPVGTSTALDGLLPLVVALCWDPIDPGLLLEYCLLPDGPLGRRVGNRLAAGLSTFPGLGSQGWEEAVTELTADDPDGKITQRLGTWFSEQRVSVGEAAPASLLAQRCRTVAAWAGGRAATADGDSPFHALAGAGARLAELFAATGGNMTAPQAARLLADALPGTAVSPHVAEAGAPLLVAHPWQIPPDTKHAIWMAPHAIPAEAPAWTTEALATLSAQGLQVDAGQNHAAARRDGDRQGLCRIGGDLLVIELPASADRHQHPAMLTLHVGIKHAGNTPHLLPRLDDPTQERLELAGWQRQCALTPVLPPQPKRLSWSPPKGGLCDRETHSYSELERRLACPLAWTLTYAAKLHGGGSVSLPEEHNLQGSFAHAVMEAVFAAGIPTPDEAAIAAGTRFDERLVRDAPPLAMPGQQVVQRQLRERVVDMARLIAETVRRAGCTKIAMEAPISESVGGRSLSGSIDCLATGKDLAVIIDLKLGGLQDRREALAKGRAVQLAIYAATRKEPTVAVAYGIINGRSLLTPERSAIPHASGYGCDIVPGAPSWRETWREFSAALDVPQPWMADEPIPARPLSDPAHWPPGTHLVLDAVPEGEVQTCCKRCQFSSLCGREART